MRRIVASIPPFVVRRRRGIADARQQRGGRFVIVATVRDVASRKWHLIRHSAIHEGTVIQCPAVDLRRQANPSEMRRGIVRRRRTFDDKEPQGHQKRNQTTRRESPMRIGAMVFFVCIVVIVVVVVVGEGSSSRR